MRARVKERVSNAGSSSPQMVASASEHGGAADVCGGGGDLGKCSRARRIVWHSGSWRRIVTLSTLYFGMANGCASSERLRERVHRFGCRYRYCHCSGDSFRRVVRVRMVDTIQFKMQNEKFKMRGPFSILHFEF